MTLNSPMSPRIPSTSQTLRRPLQLGQPQAQQPAPTPSPYNPSARRDLSPASQPVANALPSAAPTPQRPQPALTNPPPMSPQRPTFLRPGQQQGGPQTAQPSASLIPQFQRPSANLQPNQIRPPAPPPGGASGPPGGPQWQNGNNAPHTHEDAMAAHADQYAYEGLWQHSPSGSMTVAPYMPEMTIKPWQGGATASGNTIPPAGTATLSNAPGSFSILGGKSLPTGPVGMQNPLAMQQNPAQQLGGDLANARILAARGASRLGGRDLPLYTPQRTEGQEADRTQIGAGTGAYDANLQNNSVLYGDNAVKDFSASGNGGVGGTVDTLAQEAAASGAAGVTDYDTQAAQQYGQRLGITAEEVAQLRQMGFMFDANGELVDVNNHEGLGENAVDVKDLQGNTQYQGIMGRIRAQEAKTQQDAKDKSLQDEQKGYLDKLGNIDPPQLDQKAIDSQLSADAHRRAFETSRAMIAGMEASSRGGASPESQSGQIAQLQQEGGTAAAQSAAQIRMQAAMTNLQSQMAQYQQRAAALRQLAQNANDRETREAAFAQAERMQQLAQQGAIQLAQYQHDLAQQIGWGDVFNAVGGLGGSALAGWLAHP